MQAATLSVPASRGRMGTTDYYTAVVPIGAAAKLFAFDPEKMASLSPDQRTQRALKRKRVPEIARYVLDHEDYVFSSITVSISDAGRITFDPVVGQDVGVLHLPLDVEWTVNDGQHRLAGLVEAMTHDPELEKDTISVVIFPGASMVRSQQIFSDLNRTVQKTSRSLDILFDHRAPINRIVAALADDLPIFAGRVDKERLSLSGRSSALTTLASLQAATAAFMPDTGDHMMSAEEFQGRYEEVAEFWSTVAEHVSPWPAITRGELMPVEARANYVSVYGLVVWAIGSAGGELRKRADQPALSKLADIDWTKDNAEWQGVCMSGRDIVTRGPARKATADLILYKLGVRKTKPSKVLPVTNVPRRRSKAPASA